MPTHKEDHLALKAAVSGRIKHHPYGWCLSPVRPIHEYAHIFCRADFGFAITNQGELCHVYSRNNQLDRVMRMAGWLNAQWLDCYDTGLVQKYEAYGWTVSNREPFNHDLCADVPEGLTPDYVTMRRPQ